MYSFKVWLEILSCIALLGFQHDFMVEYCGLTKLSRDINEKNAELNFIPFCFQQLLVADKTEDRLTSVSALNTLAHYHP